MLAFAAGVYLYPVMPDLMVSHWGGDGAADGYLPRFWALFLIPAMTLAVYLFMLILPMIDPLRANYSRFIKYYDWFLAAFTVFMIYIYALTIAWNRGLVFNMSLAIVPAMAALFYFVGMILENSRQNWFIGIRTPWTLSSEIVWDKTNKLGAKLFKIAAIAALFSMLLGSGAFGAVILLLVGATLFLTLYSYMEFRKEKS